MKAFFILCYKHHYSRIQCENNLCVIDNDKERPKKYISFNEAENNGWSYIGIEQFKTGWLCPKCSKNNKD